MKRKKWISMLMVLAVISSFLLFNSYGNCGEEKKVLNAYLAYDNPELIFEAFKKQTGIKVSFMRFSSGEVLTRLRAEKANPQTDIWFGGGADSFIQAAKEGLLDTYTSPNSGNVGNDFKDAKGYWTGMSLSMAAMLVNKTRLTEKSLAMPKSWEDLTNPAYKGELLASNPNISGTAYTQVAAILQAKGEEKGWAFLDRLYANVPYLEQRGGGPRTKVTAGEYAVGICPEPQAAILSNPDVDIVPVFPSDGVPAWPTPVAIVMGAKHPNNARKLVDWVLSEAGQKVLMQAVPRVPCTNVTPIDGVPKLSDLNMVAYDFLAWGKERKRVLKEFNSRYGHLIP
jgi:iron(III) transport system substrate-binding protein